MGSLLTAAAKGRAACRRPFTTEEWAWLDAEAARQGPSSRLPKPPKLPPPPKPSRRTPDEVYQILLRALLKVGKDDRRVAPLLGRTGGGWKLIATDGSRALVIPCPDADGDPLSLLTTWQPDDRERYPVRFWLPHGWELCLLPLVPFASEASHGGQITVFGFDRVEWATRSEHGTARAWASATVEAQPETYRAAAFNLAWLLMLASRAPLEWSWPADDTAPHLLRPSGAPWLFAIMPLRY